VVSLCMHGYTTAYRQKAYHSIVVATLKRGVKEAAGWLGQEAKSGHKTAYGFGLEC
jgi:hypothetical protein